MVSFISGTLLKEEPCCKFMFKHDIKTYFRQFMKTSSVCFQRNATHTDLVLCNYVWLGQCNVSAEYGSTEFFQMKIFVLLDKICKSYKIA